MNMIEGSIGEPYATTSGPICCDVTVSVRVVNGRGYEALMKLMDKAYDLSTSVRAVGADVDGDLHGGEQGEA